MTCPFCGAHTADETCPECGRSRRQSRAPCSACGEMTPSAEASCSHCGAAQYRGTLRRNLLIALMFGVAIGASVAVRVVFDL